MRNRTLPFVLVLLTAIVAGCDDSAAVPVFGLVTFQRQPIENGTLTFFPESGRPFNASVTEGKYRTELVPGEYAAIVNIAIEMPPSYGRTHWNQIPPQKIVLPESYTVRAKSKLTVSVAVDQSEPINFELN